MRKQATIVFAALVFATVCVRGADAEAKIRSYTAAETAMTAGLIPPILRVLCAKPAKAMMPPPRVPFQELLDFHDIRR